MVKKITKIDCIESLKLASYSMGNCFSKNDYENWRLAFSTASIPAITILKKFSSWNDAKKEADLKTIKSYRNKVDKEKKRKEIIFSLQFAENSLGPYFSSKRYQDFARKNCLNSLASIKDYFGGLTKAKKAAGIPYKREVKKRKPITKEICIYALQLMNKTTGGVSRNDYCRWHKINRQFPSVPTIINKFGKWSIAISASEIISLKEVKKRYTKKDCINSILQAKDEIGDIFTTSQYNHWRKKTKAPSLVTIYHYYRSWKDVLSSINSLI